MVYLSSEVLPSGMISCFLRLLPVLVTYKRWGLIDKTLRFAKRLVDSNLSERVSYWNLMDKGVQKTDKRHFVNQWI